MGQRGQRDESAPKDRQSVEGIRTEIAEESRNLAPGNVQRNRNRDAARGDWDRTNRRHDENVSRDERIETEEERPAEQYRPTDE